MQPEFDVVVVGAGPAGAATALTLARNGKNVIILEKAKVPGERNMTGGVIYGSFVKDYGLINLIPEFEASAPLERKIISHEVLVLSPPNWKKGEYRYYRLSRNSIASRLGLFNVELETGHDYSVLRRRFDRWFANKAVEAGAMLSTETTALELITENGTVAGVRTTKEDIRARLVVDCSGVTSTLVETVGLRGNLVPRQLYHGIKHVYKLDEAQVSERFKVKEGEGKALLFLGEFMKGIGGGAFVYTNKDTLSVGIVASMDSMIRATTERFSEVGKLLDVLEAFETHPMLAELLEGAELVEYSGHNIPKGFKSILKRPYASGYLVAGDALGSFVKIGPMIDGMRRAIASGIMAAKTYLEASTSGSFKERNLSRYKELLAPVYEDVNASGRDSFISESSFAYQTLPKLIFKTRLLSTKTKMKVGASAKGNSDSIQQVQSRTSLLVYDEDKEFSHIKVDTVMASKSITKPWIPACPVNCYTLLTPKGIFASYKDLFEHNLSALDGTGKVGNEENRRRAFEATAKDIADGELRFDHVACVACGTCGSIGPPEMVLFTHEREGHGVRYKFG